MHKHEKGQRENKRELRRTAIHEAAHVVVALAEGCSFRDVFLQRMENRNGGVWELATRAGDDEIVRIGLAGVIAHRLSVRRWHRRLFVHADDDLRTVAAFFLGYPMDSVRVLLRYNLRATRERLVERWNAVETLADELVVKRRLAFDEAQAIVRDGLAKPRCVPVGDAPEASWDRLLQFLETRIEAPERAAAFEAFFRTGSEDALERLRELPPATGESRK